jgi:hypothetical protein
VSAVTVIVPLVLTPLCGEVQFITQLPVKSPAKAATERQENASVVISTRFIGSSFVDFETVAEGDRYDKSHRVEIEQNSLAGTVVKQAV